MGSIRHFLGFGAVTVMLVLAAPSLAQETPADPPAEPAGQGWYGSISQWFRRPEEIPLWDVVLDTFNRIFGDRGEELARRTAEAALDMDSLAILLDPATLSDQKCELWLQEMRRDAERHYAETSSWNALPRLAGFPVEGNGTGRNFSIRLSQRHANAIPTLCETFITLFNAYADGDHDALKRLVDNNWQSLGQTQLR